VEIRDILVHLEDSPAAASRLDLAILYAQRHNATLRGVYAIAHAFYQSRRIGELESVERTEALFREKTAAAGIASEWVVLDSPVPGESIADLITAEGYYCDLIIVGQPNYRVPGNSIPEDLPDCLVKGCGRPVLVVPYIGSFESAGDRIMIAWKPGRESVRSMGDALPLLKKSHQVLVVGISAEVPPVDNDGALKEVSGYLSRHEVAVRGEEVCSGDLPVGDAILNLACERTADLLVMGACAPNRRGSLELSPVAQHVLRHLTVPVLLSH
jgi:nucleotide-binding universal stress UspA family protein